MASPIRNGRIGTAYKRLGKMWKSGYHQGVDYPVPVGTPVYAVQDGKVVPNNWGKAFGNHVVVDQKSIGTGTNRIPGGWAIYAHLDKVLVQPGQEIKKGDKIGLSGNTGNSSGPHLHYEVRNNERYSAGKDVDPMPFINLK